MLLYNTYLSSNLRATVEVAWSGGSSGVGLNGSITAARAVFDNRTYPSVFIGVVAVHLPLRLLESVGASTSAVTMFLNEQAANRSCPAVSMSFCEMESLRVVV
jgi:hypothetical protein